MSEHFKEPSEPHLPPSEDDITDTDLDSIAGGGTGTYSLNCVFTSNCSGGAPE